MRAVAGDRRGALRERDRPDRGLQPAHGDPVRRGRDPAPRDDAREDGVAAAGVQAGRRRHGRELERDRRRRGGDAARARRAPGRSGSSPGPGSSRSALSGVDPYRMLHGNPQACERALAQAGLGWDDIAVIEVNEAFASVVLQFVKGHGPRASGWRDVNPNGGGISLGHPLGATGARITAHASKRARAPRGPGRDRDDVHRPGPGDRSGRRAPRLTRPALLVRGRGDRPGPDRGRRALVTLCYLLEPALGDRTVPGLPRLSRACNTVLLD